MPQICAFLVRAEAWLAHGVNDPGMAMGMEDYASHVAMFAAGVRGVALPETLFSYRKRAGSMSKAFDPHGVAFLYRRVWQANPDLLRRFGPELVGLHAENGHGALAPSIGEPSPRHDALFGRDIPDLQEIADGLEASASRERLGRALRARCWAGGAEWDYTTARLLLALDLEPAFARSLLRAAVRAEPQNGWFRLYAIISELRDGRIGAADALWNEAFGAFCATEAGAVEWIAELEAVRGFPHVAQAFHIWLDARAGVEIASPWSHLHTAASTYGGAFAELHVALETLRTSLRRGDIRGRGEAQDTVRRTAAQLSCEAAEALLARWTRTWRSPGGVHEAAVRPSFWGRAADAYLEAPSKMRGSLTRLEAADHDAWSGLSTRPREPPLVRKIAGKLRTLAGTH